MRRAFELRFDAALFNARIPPPKHTTNGDEARYPDHRALYAKCLKQRDLGIVDATAFAAFRRATGSVSPRRRRGTGDFEDPAIALGGDMKLNGPQAAFARMLIGRDSSQYGVPEVPPPPALDSDAYATELVEMYWASLLRDTPFQRYGDSELAAAAAVELDACAGYAGPRDAEGRVTPALLFRGGLSANGTTWFAGETDGPYMSQFALQAASFGALPFDQKFRAYASGVDYLTDEESFLAVQNGHAPAQKNVVDPALRYLNDGRSLAAYTHVDELYEAYFIAYLAMVAPGIAVPPNPGSPYRTYAKQQAFGTFGHPDVVATLAAVARQALNAVWYQKWVVHLRHRPEAGGGIVQSLMTRKSRSPFCDLKVLPARMARSTAVERSASTYGGSYLLSQAFPEGSPTHPAYPTGHGTVAGACITVLKFFFDGQYVIPSPVVPTDDGLSLQPYVAPAGTGAGLRVNGELHKLAHNISFGHGIHAGIHWRSDTDASIILGEAVALSYLNDLARTYHEKFKVTLTRLDGSPAVISNA
ncbi:MAG TPA: vanadium-dependent haloperoxidase [Burkholderiaceae bacterium]|nr:vanadium-dependent haloperoxidase [Burkholderiaceae bacterium]